MLLKTITTDLLKVARSTLFAALLPLFAGGGAERVPVIDAHSIVRIVTQTDFLSDMAMSIARGQA